MKTKWLFIFIASLLFVACKAKKQTIEPQQAAKQTDKLIVKGYAVFVTYKPYKVNRFVVSGSLYRRFQGVPVQLATSKHDAAEKTFYFEVDKSKIKGVDSLYIVLNTGDGEFPVQVNFSTSQNFEKEPLMVIMQPPCLCHYDKNGQPPSKYTQSSYNSGTGQTTYPYKKYKYKCVIDEYNNCYPFEDVADEIKEMLNK